MKGFFIVLEGGEGTGKTTQIKLLAEYLTAQQHVVVATKEPGGDDGICRHIRSILLDPVNKGVLDDRAETLLFLADRAQHVSTVILPELARGSIILCDRFAASTFAYQSRARNVVSQELTKTMNDFASQNVVPHLTIFLDVDPEVGLRRKGNDLSRIDSEDIEFHRVVQKGFHDFFILSGWPHVVVNADQSIEDVQKEIRANVQKYLPT